MGVSWTARALLGTVGATFVLLVISHLSPYWYSEDPYTHIGLWTKCEWRKPCVWSHENHFYWEMIQPTWWHACQVLYSLAFFTVFVTLCLVASINCGTVPSRFKQLVNVIFMLLAFVEMLATIAHFGVMAQRERGVEVGHPDDVYRNYDWAYLLACIATLLQLINVILFVYYVKKLRDKQEKEMMDDYQNPMMNPMLGPGSQMSVQPSLNFQQQQQQAMMQYQQPYQPQQPPMQQPQYGQQQPYQPQYEKRGQQPAQGPYSQQHEFIQHRQAPY